jgi:hypothetical protein
MHMCVYIKQPYVHTVTSANYAFISCVCMNQPFFFVLSCKVIHCAHVCPLIKRAVTDMYGRQCIYVTVVHESGLWSQSFMCCDSVLCVCVCVLESGVLSHVCVRHCFDVRMFVHESCVCSRVFVRGDACIRVLLRS